MNDTELMKVESSEMELSNYQESKQKIKVGMKKIAQGFVEIGYELKQIRDKESYKLDGYGSITEFAKGEYNLEQWDTSRFIAINDKYTDGSSPRLLEQYEGYKYGILAEMLSLTENELQLVSERTTRAEIRDIKLVRKEASAEENAPAHISESMETTQWEGGLPVPEKFNIPKADELLIDFFRDRSRREMLKNLAILVAIPNQTDNGINIAAAELINPNEHLMFRRKLVILMFEVDHIKYNEFQQEVRFFTYKEFLEDIETTFDLSFADPWVAYYGEPEPEPVKVEIKKPEPPKPQVKEPPKPQTKPQPKPSPEKPKKKELEVHDDDDAEDLQDSEDEEVTEEIPGQTALDFLEIRYTDTESHEDSEEQVEVVDADVVETPKSSCEYCGKEGKLLIDMGIFTVIIDKENAELVATYYQMDGNTESRTPITCCPVCGNKF